LEAREASERLVKLAPEDVEAWIMKAEAYTRGKPKEHRKDLLKSGFFSLETSLVFLEAELD